MKTKTDSCSKCNFLIIVGKSGKEYFFHEISCPDNPHKVAVKVPATYTYEHSGLLHKDK